MIEKEPRTERHRAEGNILFPENILIMEEQGRGQRGT